jgi:hypothetical protein
MTSKFLALCILFVAACGGSPTQADPLVTTIDPGPELVPTVDAGPDSAVLPLTDDAGATEDAGRVDAAPLPSEDAGTPVPAQDAAIPVDDAEAPTADAGPPAPVVTNDAGMPLCCSMLPILNASGIPVGTMPPQPCQTWGVPSGGYPVGTVVCGIAVDPVDFVCALRQDGQTASNQGTQKVCP